MNTKKILKLIKTTQIALAVIILSGCASGVDRGQGYNRINPVIFQEIPMTEIVLNTANEIKANASLKYDEVILRTTIERALSNSGLFQTEPTQPGFKLLVKIDKIRVRSTFNAVMFGAMAGSDMIEGVVELVTPEGDVKDKFNVSASYALGGVAGGQDGTRINWLYEAFAKEVVKQFQ